MRITAPPLAPSLLHARLAEVRADLIALAALLAALIGAHAFAADLRAMLRAHLRREALYVKCLLLLAALHRLRLGPPRRLAHAPWAPHVRQRSRASARRIISHAAFKGAGLSARDPRRAIAALRAVLADSERYIARIVRRIRRGFKRTPTLLLALGDDAALPALPTPRAPHADTS